MCFVTMLQDPSKNEEGVVTLLHAPENSIQKCILIGPFLLELTACTLQTAHIISLLYYTQA